MESIRFRGGSRSFERSSPFESPSPFESSAAFFFARVRRRRFLPVVVAESFSSSFGLSFPRYFRGAFRSSPAYLSSRSRNDAGTRASAWKTSAGAAAPSAVPSAPQRASARNLANASPSRTHAGAMLSASSASASVFRRTFATGLVARVPVGLGSTPATLRNPPAARSDETVKTSAFCADG